MFLTKRQSQLLDFLRRTIAVQGYAPSLEEMAAHFELSSVGTVHKHLKALEEKGFIRRQWNRSRAIEIVEMPDGRARRLPLLGRLAAGEPIDTAAHSASIAVPEDLLTRGKAFVLQVQGDTLRDEYLDDGDYVVVEQRDLAREGETVVAILDRSRAIVRRFGTIDDRVLLISRREGAAVIDVAKERCRVEGVVVGVLRRMQPPTQ